MNDASAPAADAAVRYEGVDAAQSVAGAAADWTVLDSSAGLLDAAWRRFFPATGEERLDFLHGQTTGHVKSLTPGRGCAALVLSAQGRPLGSFALYEADARLWVATTAAQAATTRAALSRFLVADDCDFEDDVDATCLTLAGPRAAAVLAASGAGDVASMEAWGLREAVVAGQAVMIFSRGDLRVPSFDVLACDAEGKPSNAATVAAALLDAGASRCGFEALEIVRVESGTARYGVDVDDRRLAVEARLEWAVHFAKGCYVGQEVIERAVSRGRINHELCLLQLSAPVAAGARVEGGNESDMVTSIARSPRLGEIALAYLPKAKADEGSAVTLQYGDTAVEAVVLRWPRERSLPGRR